MELFDTKPHVFLWLSVPFVLLLGYIDYDENIAINIHDIYIVASSGYLAILISVYFGLLGLVYWVLIQTGFKPIRWLTITHLFFTLDISFFIWLVLFFEWFSQNDSSWLSPYSNQSLVVITCSGLFILGQIGFALNIFLAFVFKKSATRG